MQSSWSRIPNIALVWISDGGTSKFKPCDYMSWAEFLKSSVQGMHDAKKSVKNILNLNIVAHTKYNPMPTS